MLDLGCAPGSWIQVAVNHGCSVVGCDLLDLKDVRSDKLLSFVKGLKKEKDQLKQLSYRIFTR